MTTPIVLEHASSVDCKICGGSSQFLDEADVLRKYCVKYFRCAACGFIQTEEPYWLDEAYSSAIARQDVGAVQRNLLNRELTAAVLNLLYPSAKQSVDYGGGHGIFVRLMRDRGFHFLWYDRHASNDYARGFEYQSGDRCDFLTAFEVLEHLADPVTDLTAMMNLSENVFVSTLLVPERVPKLADWWYSVPTTGQHISFYTQETLQQLAKRFGRNLLSRGSYHLFTAAPKSKFLYNLATSFRGSQFLNRFYRRPSLIESDFQFMIK